jgi:NTP pyrophosphatase (non-canonical NTP hydrolase)
LQKELTKYILGDFQKTKLNEEIADSLIMITQIINYFRNQNQVDKWINLKMNKLDRLTNG